MKLKWLTDTWNRIQKWAQEFRAHGNEYVALREDIKNNVEGLADRIQAFKQSDHYYEGQGQEILRTAVQSSDIENFIDIYNALDISPNYSFYQAVHAVASTGVAYAGQARAGSLLDVAINAEREDIAVFVASQSDFLFTQGKGSERRETNENLEVVLDPLPIKRAKDAGMDELVKVLNELDAKGPSLSSLKPLKKTNFFGL